MAGMLEGKAALITGAGRGIGRETAILFAREGARVLASDQNSDGAHETAAMICAAGGEAVANTCDVTMAAEVDGMVAAAIGAFGRLDCAFNNAGVSSVQVDAIGKRTMDWPEAAFDRMIEVNLKGVWLCMRAELRQMAAQGGGAIVNAASIAGLVGLPRSAGYVAAKHGVVGLTKTAAIEYAETGVRVNAVAPGYIATDMTKGMPVRREAQILAATPLRRLGGACEIAEMVCWLVSDRASYVTGATYNVDGGYVAN